MEVTGNPEKFLWLGNCPALDFVNTQVLHEGPIEDLLQTPGDLLQWLAGAGILKSRIAQIARDLGDEELQQALTGASAYRKQLRDNLADIGFHSNPAALIAKTNHLLAVPTRVERLVADATGKRKLTTEWAFTAGRDLLRPIAASTAELLATLDATRIRKCKNPDCILYFYDVSKNNTRAWCSVEICGNKLRVAEFRRRQAMKLRN